MTVIIDIIIMSYLMHLSDVFVLQDVKWSNVIELLKCITPYLLMHLVNHIWQLKKRALNLFANQTESNFRNAFLFYLVRKARTIKNAMIEIQIFYEYNHFLIL